MGPLGVGFGGRRRCTRWMSGVSSLADGVARIERAMKGR